MPANGLLKLVLTQLGKVPKRGEDKLYSQILDRARQTDAALLLIFGEAHLLSGAALVDLRLRVSSQRRLVDHVSDALSANGTQLQANIAFFGTSKRQRDQLNRNSVFDATSRARYANCPEIRMSLETFLRTPFGSWQGQGSSTHVWRPPCTLEKSSDSGVSFFDSQI